MTPALKSNLADAALATASPRVSELLALLGQGDARRPLEALLEGRPARSFSQPEETVCERGARVLGVLVHCADLRGGLDDEGLADLCAFTLQRLRFSRER